MATILITDEEYNYIKQLKDDLYARLATATPRAATFYNHIAKASTEFLSREEGKRYAAQVKQVDRETALKGNEARRMNRVKGTQQPSTGSRPGTAPDPNSTRKSA